jgi:Flp pilus assembly protein TadG
MYRRVTNRGALRRRAATALLTCVCLTAVLFLAALAIDMGNLMAARRQAQNCADAAALSGCIQLASLQAQGSAPTLAKIKSAALLSASHNNYVDGSNCTVTVNWPPTSGNFQDSNSVEVLLTFTGNNLVVRGSNSVTVRSVASCNMSGTKSFPMLVLDPTGADAFWVNSGSLTLSNAPVVVDSNNSNAAAVSGMSSSTVSATVRAVGGSAGSFSPAAKTGVDPVPDPYALLQAPSTAGMTTYTQSSYSPNSSGNITLNPGYYPNGLYCINGGNVTLNPGVYYVSGGNFWINTPGTVTGNGVTIYHAGADSSAKLSQSYGLDVGICLCPTDNDYSFTPPTSGPYAGVSFFQSRTTTSEAFYDFWGKGQLNVGLQYFPNNTLRCWSKSNGVINCNELVTKDFKLTGTHEIYGNTQNGGFSKLTWNASRAGNRPTTSVYLAE